LKVSLKKEGKTHPGRERGFFFGFGNVTKGNPFAEEFLRLERGLLDREEIREREKYCDVGKDGIIGYVKKRELASETKRKR